MKGFDSCPSGDSSPAYGYGKTRAVASLVGAASAVADQYSGSGGLDVDMSESWGGKTLSYPRLHLRPVALAYPARTEGEVAAGAVTDAE